MCQLKKDGTGIWRCEKFKLIGNLVRKTPYKFTKRNLVTDFQNRFELWKEKFSQPE